MDVFEAIEKRRAVKLFDPEAEIRPEDERRMLDAARLAPTAFNMQNWRFVKVRDPEIRAGIRAAAWDQAQMTEASLLVVICADLKAWKRRPERYWSHAPAEFRDLIVRSMQDFYRGRPDMERDEAMRSCGLAAMNLMLAAEALGYHTCPMDGFDFDRVAELIALPEDHVIGLIVAIGRQRQPVWPRGGRLPAEEVEFEDGFPAGD